MNSDGMVMELKPGCYEEYKRRHDDLWPELADVMASFNINMVIYRFGEHLFVYGTAPSGEAWAQLNEHRVTPRCNAHMAEVLETDESGQIIVQSLPEAFAFGEFRQD